MLILYDESILNADVLTNAFNGEHSNRKFTPSHERDQKISFLDLLITRNASSLQTDIYRQPATTGTTIHYLSNRLLEHKMAACRYLLYCMNPLSLSAERKP